MLHGVMLHVHVYDTQRQSSKQRKYRARAFARKLGGMNAFVDTLDSFELMPTAAALLSSVREISPARLFGEAGFAVRETERENRSCYIRVHFGAL